MSGRLLIWGAGGHGRVVADAARASGVSEVGFIDADPAKVGADVPGGGRVVWSQEAFLDRVSGPGGATDARGAVGSAEAAHDTGDAHGWEGVPVVPGVGANDVRAWMLERLPAPATATVVHPSATVSPSAVLGRGTVVLPGAIVNAGARIGAGVVVNSGAIVEHDCVLGDAVHVAPGAVLGGAVRVGAGTLVGLGARILPGVAIGAGVRIGAGATVIRDVADDETVAGVPARPVGG